MLGPSRVTEPYASGSVLGFADQCRSATAGQESGLDMVLCLHAGNGVAATEADRGVM